MRITGYKEYQVLALSKKDHSIKFIPIAAEQQKVPQYRRIMCNVNSYSPPRLAVMSHPRHAWQNRAPVRAQTKKST